MRLDQTTIAIRPRSASEILDLMLLVIRRHFRSLAVLLAVSALPFVALNYLATWWMIDEAYVDDYVPMFFWTQALLVTGQSAWAMAPVTVFLGTAMFEQPPTLMRVFREVLTGAGALVWLHGMLRMAIPVTALAFLISADEVTAQPVVLTWMVILLLIGLLLRLLRPFVNEITLLERTPFRKKSGTRITFRERSRTLHHLGSGDILLRGAYLSSVSVLFSLMFLSGWMLLDLSLSLHTDPSETLLRWYWPAALWMTALMAAVARFLFYIDARIRQEGWAVELRIRAEAARLNRHWEVGA